jgi:hypothetical protein
MDESANYRTYVKSGLATSDNLEAVQELIARVSEILTSEKVREAIQSAHVFNASSHAIQAAILDEMLDLGFTSEKKGLFANFQVSGIRPDYFKDLGGGGVLFEVERGKTIANNMDLLDVWKTHICSEAKHLFLLVPLHRVTENGRSQKIYQTVCNRIEAFFTPTVEPIDVDTVTVFAY